MRKWLVREDSERLPSGITQPPSVRNEIFDKKVKRKMVGTLKAEGEGGGGGGGKRSRRKASIRETVRELRTEGDKM